MPITLGVSRSHPLARLRLAALLAALAGHAAVLYGVTREQPDSRAGGHGLLLDAVNVAMVDSSILESRASAPLPPSPATAEAVEPNEGTTESKASPQRSAQKEQKAENRVPDEPVPAEAIVKTPPKALERRQVPEKERKEASTAAAPVGGAVARGDALNSAKQSAPAAASPGAVRAYASSVQRALTRIKPKCARRFTVRIKLLVFPGGGIESIEILKSSGNKRLDATVLAEVQRIRLPTPPPGLALEDRWYEFPVRCR